MHLISPRLLFVVRVILFLSFSFVHPIFQSHIHGPSSFFITQYLQRTINAFVKLLQRFFFFKLIFIPVSPIKASLHSYCYSWFFAIVTVDLKKNKRECPSYCVRSFPFLLYILCLYSFFLFSSQFWTFYL